MRRVGGMLTDNCTFFRKLNSIPKIIIMFTDDREMRAMKKLFVLTFLLLGQEMPQRAAACDMAAIESWVSMTCNGNRCAPQTTAQRLPQGCDGRNCTRFRPASSKVGCASSDCVTAAPAQSTRLQ